MYLQFTRRYLPSEFATCIKSCFSWTLYDMSDVGLSCFMICHTSMRMKTSSFARCGVILTDNRLIDSTEAGIMRCRNQSTHVWIPGDGVRVRGEAAFRVLYASRAEPQGKKSLKYMHTNLCLRNRLEVYLCRCLYPAIPLVVMSNALNPDLTATVTWAYLWPGL